MTDSISQDAPGTGPWRTDPPPADFTRFPDSAVDADLGSLFLHTAAEYPANTALRSPSGSWTYEELAEWTNRIAGGIEAAVDADEPAPVALLIAHDGPLVAAILGTILSGNIVVVLDPVAPLEQLSAVLDEARPGLVIHDHGYAKLAATACQATSGQPTLALLDTLDTPLVNRPERGPNDAMMLAFTSGTSGVSKGGIITHGVLTNLIRGATNALGITSSDRIPMLFPTSLAVAAYPMFLPILNGGTLATLDVRSVGLAPVADFLEQERITLAYMAPTVVRFLVDSLAGRSFPDLRLIALGGELVDAEVVKLTADVLGPDIIANGFGTTETGVITLYLMDPSDPPLGAVPAGYPVDDVELLVLDEGGEPLAAGEPGEIAVASPYVFKGYWGHDDLNATVLSADPKGREGWRLYRTGDLGFIDPHGALVVSGRVDTKVKVRGRFVVLGDVEAAIHTVASVADAAVVATNTDGVVELVGMVVPADPNGAPLDTQALRAELLSHHEAYRVPSRWVVLSDLPRLPNGKIDRRALHTLQESDLQSNEPLDELASERWSGPRSEASDDTVRDVRDVWEALLTTTVGDLDADFFEIGGDSLLAAQMLVHLEHRTGVTVPMGELVAARTVRQVAAVVNRLASAPDVPPPTTSMVQAGDPSRPRLWFVHDLQGSAYRVRHVAEHLGDDQPVWSFESPLLRGEPNPFRSLETFAARYITDLRAAQPEGPYWLAGYSFGGICAYEMARQLRADGEEVAFLGVVDVGPGYRGPGWEGNRSPLRPWFGIAQPPPPDAGALASARHYVDMVRASPAGAIRHLMVRTGLSRRIDPLRFRKDLRENGRVRPEWRLWYAWEEHWNLAATAWDRSSTYEGAMDLFWASNSASADATMGWDPLVTELSIHRFEGDHMGTLESFGAGPFGAALRGVIDDRIASRAS